MSRSLTVLLAAALLACRGDHDHGPAEDERPGLSVTLYQGGLELFMEYPALVAGQASPLVAHFTDARDPEGFRPITQGQVTATLRHAGGGPDERFVAPDLLRTGIFKPIVTPARTGKATLTLELAGPVSGVVEVGEVTVFSTVEEARAAIPDEEAGEPTLPFLKEQQWKTVYATALAERRALRGGVRASGELRAVPGKAADIAAAVAGRVAVSGEVPRLGQRVREGQLLATILPIGPEAAVSGAALEAEVARARAAVGLAEREVKRLEELLAARAVPGRQVDEARVALDIARSTLTSAERQLALQRSHQTGSTTASRAGFELRSPIDGVIAHADVTPGAVVEAGRRILAVVDAERLWLVAHASEADAPRVQQSPGARFEVAGLEKVLTVDEDSGRRVAVGPVIDPVTRTVPVIFEIANPEGVLKPGMFAKVTLFTGEEVQGVAVPEEAVVDDGGKPTVYVLKGGESFLARRVRTGARSGGFVQILSGVDEGERIVSRGAYEIKLASSGGAIPEHGHSH